MCRNSLFNVITLITAICDEGNYSFLQYTVYIFSFSFILELAPLKLFYFH